MGRGTALRIPDSQTLSVFYRAGQNRIRQIEEQIVTLTAERRELMSACQSFAGDGNSTQTATSTTQAGTQPTEIRKRKPMSQAHKARLREAALNRKQAGTATSTGAGAAPSPPGPTPTKQGKGKTPAMAAAG
jgi:hypothetical protein